MTRMARNRTKLIQLNDEGNINMNMEMGRDDYTYFPRGWNRNDDKLFLLCKDQQWVVVSFPGELVDV